MYWREVKINKSNLRFENLATDENAQVKSQTSRTFLLRTYSSKLMCMHKRGQSETGFPMDSSLWTHRWERCSRQAQPQIIILFCP